MCLYFSAPDPLRNSALCLNRRGYVPEFLKLNCYHQKWIFFSYASVRFYTPGFLQITLFFCPFSLTRVNVNLGLTDI